MVTLEDAWQGRDALLEILIYNQRALAFYRSIGFQEQGLVLRRRHGTSASQPSNDESVVGHRIVRLVPDPGDQTG